jgi:hypothetical protein
MNLVFGVPIKEQLGVYQRSVLRLNGGRGLGISKLGK